VDAKTNELAEAESRREETLARIENAGRALQDREHELSARKSELEARATGLSNAEKLVREASRLAEAAKKDLGERQGVLARRERELDETRATLDREAKSLAGQAEQHLSERKELDERERKLWARNMELEAKAAELSDAEERVRQASHQAEAAKKDLGERQGVLARRERELDETRATLDREAKSLAGRAEQHLAERKELERQFAARDKELKAREVALMNAERDTSAPGPALRLQTDLTKRARAAGGRAPARTGRGAWNVNTLDGLIRERGDEFPDRVEEWRDYLFYLRDFADVDGRLPSSFDALAADVFAPLASERRVGGGIA
jgi:chromosome segregation ATPase